MSAQKCLKESPFPFLPTTRSPEVVNGPASHGLPGAKAFRGEERGQSPRLR